MGSLPFYSNLWPEVPVAEGTCRVSGISGSDLMGGVQAWGLELLRCLHVGLSQVLWGRLFHSERGDTELSKGVEGLVHVLCDSRHPRWAPSEPGWRRLVEEKVGELSDRPGRKSWSCHLSTTWYGQVIQNLVFLSLKVSLSVEWK